MHDDEWFAFLHDFKKQRFQLYVLLQHYFFLAFFFSFPNGHTLQWTMDIDNVYKDEAHDFASYNPSCNCAVF